ncbi:hypothetical protein CspHIS471_0203750 [Cutaneotrichosporon sp. HIS471]|nr:hypothetical protein CspHIS471_0203750 [Cutaneotrichosporon sp. HIS471]
MNINTTNPYADHPQLSTLEGEVLWEYAKLADKVKKLCLEKEMKLVFTMYRAAVYNVSQAAEMRDAENEAAFAAQEQSRRTPDQSWEDEGSTIMF